MKIFSLKFVIHTLVDVLNSSITLQLCVNALGYINSYRLTDVFIFVDYICHLILSQPYIQCVCMTKYAISYAKLDRLYVWLWCDCFDKRYTTKHLWLLTTIRRNTRYHSHNIPFRGLQICTHQSPVTCISHMWWHWTMASQFIRVTSHGRHDCLLNSLFMPKPSKPSNLGIPGPLWGNSPVSSGFPRANNAESAFMWWSRHVHVAMLILNDSTRRMCWYELILQPQQKKSTDKTVPTVPQYHKRNCIYDKESIII